MSSYRTRSREPLYPSVMLRPVPFPLPPAFLDQLGYGHAVAAVRPMTVEAAGQKLTRAGDCEPRRFVALWWDAVANQLGWSDGLRRGVCRLDRQVWSAWLHARGLLGLVGAWLVEHEVRLDGDGSAPPPSQRAIGHWLIVDGAQNRAWVVVRGLARMIVCRQQLEPTEAELSELEKLANDPTLSAFYL